MSWLNLVSNLPDRDADRLAACMAAIEHSGLWALVHEESGARRLLPRAVVDALSEERGTVAAVLAMIRSVGADGGRWAGCGSGADAGIVARQRAGWQAIGDAFADRADDDGSDTASDAGDSSEHTDDESWDDRTDAECLVHAMNNAAFESREAWGRFMLAVGAAAGLAWSQQQVYAEWREGWEPSALDMHLLSNNAVNVAADWCHEGDELDGLSGAA